MLTCRDPFLYLLGNREAIRKVCSSRWSLWVGIVFIATAVVARNYDHAAIHLSPKRMAMPYVMALVSSCWIFLVLWSALREGRLQGRVPFSHQYRSFLGAFVMTAPLAWLYAIPVERWMDPVSAVWANVSLLAAVALWRVLLIARVTSVICEQGFGRCLIFVSAPASLEFFVAGVVTSVFSLEGIATAMAGVHLEPSPAVVAAQRAAGMATQIAFGILVLSSILYIGREKYARAGFPAVAKDTLPWALLVGAVLVFGAAIRLARPMQRAETHWHILQRHLTNGRYAEALDYLEAMGPDGFPQGRVIPLDPMRYDAVWRLPQLLHEIDASRANWLVEASKEHTLTLMRRVVEFYHPEYLLELTESLATIPGGREFIQAHRADWERFENGLQVLRELELVD